jgi:hypothetical protein
MNRDTILAVALAATPKAKLDEHREAVQALRDKGFTWLEIADFLTEQSVQPDHTRIYRTFGEAPKERHTESRNVEILRITYLGVRKTRKNKSWNVMEIELSSRLVQPIPVIGHTWESGAAKYALGDRMSIAFRNAALVIKAGGGFPMAFITAEFQAEGDYWSPQEVYIMPKWEALL